MSAIWSQVMGRYSYDIETLKAEYAQLQAEFEDRMSGYSQRLQVLWQAIRHDLDVAIPDLESYPLPRPVYYAEVGDGLYNSERDYIEQIEAYKLFQGKEEH